MRGVGEGVRQEEYVCKFEHIEAYDAGDFPEDISRKYGVPLRKIVNLNSNENPYPLPRSVIHAIYEAAKHSSRYPDPKYPELKEAISSYIGVPAENIVLGTGANDIFSCICNILEPLDRVVIPIPTYTMYAFYAMMRDASLKFIETAEEKCFVPSSEEIINAAEDAKLVFLCSPCNPTGAVLPPAEIKKIVEHVNAIVVVDEAYAEFSGKSVVSDALEHENLVVVRSFSKFFALAGLRIGYAVAPKQLASLFEKLRQPFAISSIGAKAAVQAIKEVEYFNKIRDKIVEERAYLYESLKKISFLKPFPSEANFILVKLSIAASELMESLYKKGIIIRNVTDLLGLKGNFVRITVGRRSENRRLVEALKNLE